MNQFLGYHKLFRSSVYWLGGGGGGEGGLFVLETYNLPGIKKKKKSLMAEMSQKEYT